LGLFKFHHQVIRELLDFDLLVRVELELEFPNELPDEVELVLPHHEVLSLFVLPGCPHQPLFDEVPLGPLGLVD